MTTRGLFSPTAAYALVYHYSSARVCVGLCVCIMLVEHMCAVEHVIHMHIICSIPNNNVLYTNGKVVKLYDN